MRQNLPVTQRERTFIDAERLISTTDLNSKITYVNDAFVAISGFSREELVGQPHNIVRHPDMPPGVFGHMWETIKQGKPWMGIVKNRCKNGDHYWVSAYVTPHLRERQAGRLRVGAHGAQRGAEAPCRGTLCALARRQAAGADDRILDP